MHTFPDTDTDGSKMVYVDVERMCDDGCTTNHWHMQTVIYLRQTVTVGTMSFNFDTSDDDQLITQVYILTHAVFLGPQRVHGICYNHCYGVNSSDICHICFLPICLTALCSCLLTLSCQSKLKTNTYLLTLHLSAICKLYPSVYQ